MRTKDDPVAIGIDLGGTTLKAGLVTERGLILHQRRIQTLADDCPDAVIGQIESLVRHLQSKSASRAPVPVGIGSPGIVDDEGVVKSPPNFRGWSQVPLASEIQKRFRGIRVVVENDANVAAIAESKFGVGGILHDTGWHVITAGKHLFTAGRRLTAAGWRLIDAGCLCDHFWMGF